MNIQWFPGHMAKARRLITENFKYVDAVCEIIDARIPLSSRNPDLDELISDKPRLIILGRIDQADPVQTQKWSVFLRTGGAAVIETDNKSGRGVQNLQKAVQELLAEKIAVYQAKGQSGRIMRLMVVGIPNVGKSSFINRAAKRKAAQASDKPGVTRGKQWIKIGAGIEMLDMPGVLWPKFDDGETAENLAFTGAIRDEILDIETLGARLMLKLAVLYPGLIDERYKIKTEAVITGEDDDGFNLLAAAAAARGFLLRGGEYDMQRMAVILLDEFRGGKLGRITLEQCGGPLKTIAGVITHEVSNC